MSNIPNRAACIALLEQAGCEPIVIAHCGAVAGLALEMAAAAEQNGVTLDIPLIEAGALLHDIGRAKTHGIAHALEGAAIARKKGLPVALVAIIEHHIGAGIDADEAHALKLPARDYLPQTPEEKIVAHADNLISVTTRRPLAKAIAKLEKKGRKAAVRRLRTLHNDVSALCGVDADSFVTR